MDLTALTLNCTLKRSPEQSNTEALARVVDKKQICNGNVETVRGTLSRDSIIAWHFRSFRRKHKRMHAWVSRPPGRARVLRFTRAADLDRWIETLRPVGRSG